MKRNLIMLGLFLVLIGVAASSLAAGLVLIKEGEWPDDEADPYISEPGIGSEYALYDGAQMCFYAYFEDDAENAHLQILEKDGGASVAEEDVAIEDGCGLWILPDGLFSEGEYIFTAAYGDKKSEAPFSVYGRDRADEVLGVTGVALEAGVRSSMIRFDGEEAAPAVLFDLSPRDYTVLFYEILDGTEIIYRTIDNASSEYHGYAERMSKYTEGKDYYFMVHQSGESVGVRFRIEDGEVISSEMSEQEIALLVSLAGITVPEKIQTAADAVEPQEPDENEENTDLSNYGLYLTRYGNGGPVYSDDGLLDLYEPGQGAVFALVEGGNYLASWYAHRSERRSSDFLITAAIERVSTGEIVYEKTFSSEEDELWMPKGVYLPKEKYKLTLTVDDESVSVTFETMDLAQSKKRLPEFEEKLYVGEPELTNTSGSSKTYRLPVGISSLEKIRYYTFYYNSITDTKGTYLSDREMSPSSPNIYMAAASNSTSIEYYVVVQGEQAAGRMILNSSGDIIALNDCVQGVLCNGKDRYWIETDPEKVEEYRSDPSVTIISTSDDRAGIVDNNLSNMFDTVRSKHLRIVNADVPYYEENQLKGRNAQYPKSTVTEVDDTLDGESMLRQLFMLTEGPDLVQDYSADKILEAFQFLSWKVSFKNSPVTSRYRRELPDEYSAYAAVKDFLSFEPTGNIMSIMPVVFAAEDGSYLREIELAVYYRGDTTKDTIRNILFVMTNQKDVRDVIQKMMAFGYLGNPDFYTAWMENTEETFRYDSEDGTPVDMELVLLEKLTGRQDGIAGATGICTANSVNIRREPNKNSGSVGQLSKGKPLTIVEDLGEWVLIDSAAGQGYIKAQYIQLD